MREFILENEILRCTFCDLGAELQSVEEKGSGRQYLWNGDPSFWGRRSPVLFPLVGSLKDKKYRYEGKTYEMSQHGFARDQVFVPEEQTADTLWFSLEDSEATRKNYPFSFRLKIGYRLQERKLSVLWRVENTGDQMLYFSIGAHPAFCCPMDGKGEQTDYYLGFDTEEEIVYSLIDESGLKAHENNLLPVEEDGTFRITKNLFDQDALIVENRQAHKVSLLTPDKTPYVIVEFNAPLFGLWSPAGKSAPFICIEPWYGRCDSAWFTGSLAEREYGNALPAGEIFEKEYSMEFVYEGGR